ncbi:hypothetical protein D3C77_417800 [compost metagenome]
MPFGQLAPHMQAFTVLGDLQPLAYGDLPGAMVKEHADLASLRFKRLLVGARQDDVAVTIDDIEHAGIALEDALGSARGEFDLGQIEGQGLFDTWHLLPPE